MGKLTPKNEWEKAYEAIEEFERQLSDAGAIIVKFWLHISKGEQKRRFLERLNNPDKHWKFSEADVAERGIVVTGGGALLRDIDKLLMEETGLPVVIADDPLTCVARGGGRILELMDELGPGHFGLE